MIKDNNGQSCAWHMWKSNYNYIKTQGVLVTIETYNPLIPRIS